MRTELIFDLHFHWLLAPRGPPVSRTRDRNTMAFGLCWRSSMVPLTALGSAVCPNQARSSSHGLLFLYSGHLPPQPALPTWWCSASELRLVALSTPYLHDAPLHHLDTCRQAHRRSSVSCVSYKTSSNATCAFFGVSFCTMPVLPLYEPATKPEPEPPRAARPAPAQTPVRPRPVMRTVPLPRPPLLLGLSTTLSVSGCSWRAASGLSEERMHSSVTLRWSQNKCRATRYYMQILCTGSRRLHHFQRVQEGQGRGEHRSDSMRLNGILLQRPSASLNSSCSAGSRSRQAVHSSGSGPSPRARARAREPEPEPAHQVSVPSAFTQATVMRRPYCAPTGVLRAEAGSWDAHALVVDSLVCS